MNEFEAEFQGLSPLITLAAQMHEMFNAFLVVGFDERQSLYLTAKMIRLETEYEIENGDDK